MLIKNKIKENKIILPEWFTEALWTVKDKINIIAPIAMLICLLISYCISIRIYRKKEF